MSEERYEIRGKIGGGGVGAVYRAYDKNLNREVALKRVLPEGGHENQEEATRQLVKEASALSSIQHPHIVTVYDAGVDEDGPYVVMELISGQTLDALIEHGTLTWEDFREVAMQTQEALIAAQELNLVHRDLKPGNVMVSWLPSGKFQIKLVDFGLAKFSAQPSLQTIDQGDAVFGSIYFMAPEQFERVPLDQRVDLYSMGALYYYCLTGEYPFTGETAPQVMAAHLQHLVDPLHEKRPDIPEWAAAWVMWHMERDRDYRPASAREALERFLALERDAQNGASSAAANRPKFLFPGAAPATPAAVPAPTRSTSLQPPARPSTSLAKTAPQPLQPPDGAKPSVHTAPQKVHAEPATPSEAIRPAASSAAPAAVSPARPIPRTAAPAKAPGNQGTKIAIGAILVVFIGIAAIVLSHMIASNREAEAFAQLLDASQDGGEVPVTEQQARALMDRATASGLVRERPEVYRTLASATAEGGWDLDYFLAEEITTRPMEEKVRVDLLNVLALRKNPETVQVLLKFAAEHDAKDTARAAVAATAEAAEKRHFPAYLELIATHEATRPEAERVATKILLENEDTGSLERQIVRAYESAQTPQAEQTLIRLLGHLGGDQADEILTRALASDSDTTRLAALIALQNWKDESMFPRLTDAAATQPEPMVREKAFEAAINFLRLNREREGNNNPALWKELAPLAETDRQKRAAITGLVNEPGEWPRDLIASFTEEPHAAGVRAYAEKALEKLDEGAP